MLCLYLYLPFKMQSVVKIIGIAIDEIFYSRKKHVLNAKLRLNSIQIGLLIPDISVYGCGQKNR